MLEDEHKCGNGALHPKYLAIGEREPGDECTTFLEWFGCDLSGYHGHTSVGYVRGHGVEQKSLSKDRARLGNKPLDPASYPNLKSYREYVFIVKEKIRRLPKSPASKGNTIVSDK